MTPQDALTLVVSVAASFVIFFIGYRVGRDR